MVTEANGMLQGLLNGASMGHNAIMMIINILLYRVFLTQNAAQMVYIN